MRDLLFQSSRFGEVVVASDIVLSFPQGMLGFAGLERYVIVKQREDSVFLWLHSVEQPELAFPLILPWAFWWDYELRISDADMAAVGLRLAEQLSVYCVVTITGDLRDATVDLLAPIVINDGARRARQVVNAAPGYSTRDPLFPRHDGPTPVAMRGDDARHVAVLSGGRA
jgi:flagellar assembly factor FliW